MKSSVVWDAAPAVRWKSPLLATCFHTGFFIDLFFDHEDGSEMFL
jgi:hypothetical protein